VNIRKTGELLLLINSGANLSVLKEQKLIPSIEYDPGRKVKVKSISRCLDRNTWSNRG
jgi:hypothetical protein